MPIRTFIDKNGVSRSETFTYTQQELADKIAAHDAAIAAQENARANAIAAKRAFDSLPPNANDQQIRTAINLILKWIRDNNFPEDPVAPL